MIDEKKLKKYIMTEINPYGKPFDGTVYEFGNMLMEYIERMEKYPERKWIPVSERLPECKGIYLITSKVFDKAEVQYVFYQKNIEMFICNGTAIAWQPLPEPYKAGEHE